ncbi:MAG: hemolysin III family protein [Clostridia bacterium]|nr:hemolysin III family protein [Clostridia bacterium]
MKRTKLINRILPKYTKGEEIFNMVTHIVGGALGIAAIPLCVIKAVIDSDAYGIVSGAIFGATMVILYCMSSIYHGLSPKLTAKKVFQIIDHCTIFILIAGTYTPFCLCTIRGFSPFAGWTLFGILWGVAALGITLNAIDLRKYKVFSMVCYLTMGWCVLSVIKPTVEALTVPGMLWLLSGGIFYTLGAILYGIGSKIKYFHSVFHIFCVFGSITHLICILFYVLI